MPALLLRPPILVYVDGERPEWTAQGYRRFRYLDCTKQFNERSSGLLNLCWQAASVASQLGWNRLSAYTMDRVAFFRWIGWRLVALITSEPGNQRVWYFEHYLADNDDRVAVVSEGGPAAR
jgi:hypothetical protein